MLENTDERTVFLSGHVNWDVTLRVDRLPEPDGEASIRERRRSGGGSAANVAAALAELGITSELLGSVGDDEHGSLARRELERTGVDVSGVREVPDATTATKYLLVDDDGEVAVVGADGVNEAVRPEHVDADRVRAADHVHLTSQRPETAAYIARVADDADVPVSVDPGRRFGDRDFDGALAHAAVVFATGREADALLEAERTGAIDEECTLVVTAGADGAVAHAPDGRYVHEGFDVDPVDTAGAGDAFAAGYIAATLAGGERTGSADPAYERALALANACGALAARTAGARCDLSSAEVDRLLERRE